MLWFYSEPSGDLAHKKIFPALYHMVRVSDSIQQQGSDIDQEALAKLLKLLRWRFTSRSSIENTRCPEHSTLPARPCRAGDSLQSGLVEFGADESRVRTGT
jgi:hypothetical protein